MTHPAAEVINYSKDHGANVSFHIQLGYLVVIVDTFQINVFEWDCNSIWNMEMCIKLYLSKHSTRLQSTI